MKPVDIKEERYSYGVIDPQGNFYPCHYEGHHWLANRLQKDGVIPEDADAYTYFEEQGWLVLTGAMLVDCEFTFNFHPEIKVYTDKGLEYNKTEKTLTSQQVEAVLNYKSARNQTELNFNFDDMSVEEFKKLAAENFDYYKD
jgi:glutamate 5-kinase